MGANNPEYDAFYDVCKVGTGFKDDMLKSLHEKLSPDAVSQKPANYLITPSIKPDVFFKPKYVWELTADSFSTNKFIRTKQEFVSLRFPRFLRERPDKDIKDSTSTQQLMDIAKIKRK